MDVIFLLTFHKLPLSIILTCLCSWGLTYQKVPERWIRPNKTTFISQFNVHFFNVSLGTILAAPFNFWTKLPPMKIFLQQTKRLTKAFYMWVDGELIIIPCIYFSKHWWLYCMISKWFLLQSITYWQKNLNDE